MERKAILENMGDNVLVIWAETHKEANNLASVIVGKTGRTISHIEGEANEPTNTLYYVNPPYSEEEGDEVEEKWREWIDK